MFFGLSRDGLPREEWNQHKNATTHRRLCQLLVEIYPEWNPDAFPTQGSDSLVLQSTNLAPGILGAPPPGPLIPNRRMMGGVDSHAALGPNRKSPMANKQGNNIYRPKQPVRMGANDELGRVVHISQLPRVRCTNIDLIKLAEPFGNVTNSLVVKTKSEAFIELAYTEAAQAMVKYYRNKPAFLRGSVVRVDLSQKYKKMTIKGQESEENSRVVHISNLPSVGYSDAEIVSLGMPFGRVTNYLLMRVKNQVFLEMESHQAGMTMVEKFKKMPLLFHGRELKVYLSQKYKNLVLRKQGKDVAELMKNKDQDDSFSLGSNRKRGRSDSPSSKGVRSPSLKRKAQDKPKTSTGSDQEKVQLDSPEEGKDPKHTEGEDPGEIKKVQEEPLPDIESYAQLSEAEEELLLAYTESVKDEAETADAEGVMETEAEAETGFSNKSESKEEVGDAQPNPQLTEKPTQKDVWCPKYTEEYFSLDEADDVAQKRKTDTNDKRDEQDIKKQSPDGKENSEAEIKQDQDVKSTSHSACVEPVSDDAESLSPLPEEYRLGPYRPNNPVGLDYVVQKTGYYCKLCRLFYTTEEVAKQAHCSSMNHYQKLKKMLAKHAADYREKRAFAKDSEMTEELCNK
ncbi:matrin-3 isoform X2 [Callorhinchus milii]|uniref:Matrin-3-like n=2 Tax=Callorhinchus milii TaxID=7868 RepID=A0A4W3KHZ5_CALMI|nr:matrin-3 isoform X2 [Callorhinchus milii]|eukprot:gi/632948329/ref/XP_007889546.1/ PREDICTED: matrin-3-like isoform X2 [Callorhinchus milii]